ncbi:MAG: hypothetical protein K6F99_01255, partial [Lachnospiraceae bacterium]|nr:hypothetical protein [Lachnospiraceae bacterium]
YTVRTNGDVKITARDCFENESEKIINISKIDCEGPVIEITGNPTSTVYKSCRLDIKAVDNKSGVTEIWYKNNTANVPSLLQNYGVNSDGMGRETGSSSATINLNGSYTFYAYDALGNMSEQTVTVSKISKQKEEDRDSQDNSKGKSSDSSEKKQTSEEDKKMVLSPGIVTSGTAENVISKTGYSSSGSDSGSAQDGKGIVIKSRNDEETESETDGEITFKNANGDGELDFYVDESIDEETQNESAYVLPEESTEETVESSESISPQNYSQGAVQSDPAVELINTAGGEEEKKKGNVLPVVGGVAAALLGAGGGGLVILNKKGLIDLATLLEKKKG